ncbi:MAG: hypothetical protein AAB663_01235 [Patescibacteria group bacterium]
MTLRQYLLALTFGTVAAIAAAMIVIFGIDPVTAGGAAFVALYITLGATCVGILTILGTLWRVHTNEDEEVNDAVARSLRQGVFLSIIALVGLYLSAHSYLTIWTTLLLVVFMSLVEFFFLAAKKG